MDRKLVSETVALLLLFAAFPIISIGTTGGSGLIWGIGLACAVAGGLLPISTRYMDHTLDRIRDMGWEFDDRPS